MANIVFAGSSASKEDRQGNCLRALDPFWMIVGDYRTVLGLTEGLFDSIESSANRADAHR
jgi:hypothetical protein